MALLEISLHSQALKRTVNVTAIVPSDKEGLIPGQKFKTLYLLHGVYGNQYDWLSGTRIQRWAEEKNLAVIMPAGENSFYVDGPGPFDKYSTYIGAELVQQTRALLPLSDKYEDTFIAGLSMGGYGAIVNGLKYCTTFSHIGLLSAALIIEKALKSTDDEPNPLSRRKMFIRVFGNLEALKGSDKDYEALTLKADPMPQIYMAIGTKDSLLPANRSYHQFLLAHHIPVTYEEGEGAHTWDFWDTYVQHLLAWLPL